MKGLYLPNIRIFYEKDLEEDPYTVYPTKKGLEEVRNYIAHSCKVREILESRNDQY